MTSQAERKPTDRPEFPVVWNDPADRDQTWFWDATHFPYPLAVLSMDLSEMAIDAWNRLSGHEPGEATRGRFANGFFYFMWRPHDDSAGHQDRTAVEARKPAWKEAAERDAARLMGHWSEDVRPRIEQLCRSVTAPDFEAMSTDELIRQLRQHFRASADAFGLTQMAMNALFTALDPFVDWCKSRFGADAYPLIGTMLDGVPNETLASDVALYRIARNLGESPAVLKALSRDDLSDLRTLAGSWEHVSAAARQVLAALERYLDRYGWRPEIWFDLSKPTWREDPRPALELLRLYATDSRASPIVSARRAAARRRGVARRLERELAAEGGGKLDEFRLLYGRALPYVTVREGRALWQLTSTGVLRRPVRVLGRKLVRSGHVHDESDVIHLTLAEIEALDARPQRETAELAESRRREHERWRQVVPPAVIGTMDSRAKDQVVYFSGLAALGNGAVAAGRILKGRPASRGVVTGKVKVITDLAQAAGFARGEVLVCRTTSPAWTPLVARAAAVVTDSGGPLAHTAIVAREFAIPCVLAVGDATRRLHDGMTVTVDGGQGIVRIE